MGAVFNPFLLFQFASNCIVYDGLCLVVIWGDNNKNVASIIYDNCAVNLAHFFWFVVLIANFQVGDSVIDQCFTAAT